MEAFAYSLIYETEKRHWWYRVRRLLVHALMKQHLSPAQNLSILDVGSGAGALLTELSPYGTVTGTDNAQEAIKYCRARGVHVEFGELPHLPLKDGTFDVVLALDVLEHIEDDLAAARDIYRVIKDGGKVIIFVPAFMFLWGVTDRLGHHYRRYTRARLVSVLEEAGFSIVRATYFNTILFVPIATVRLLVKWLGITMKTENRMGTSLFNGVLYGLFRVEVFLLRFMNFPFGVSCAVVARKGKNNS